MNIIDALILSLETRPEEWTCLKDYCGHDRYYNSKRGIAICLDSYDPTKIFEGISCKPSFWDKWKLRKAFKKWRRYNSGDIKKILGDPLEGLSGDIK